MRKPKRTVRIGCGSAYANDRIQPAVDLVEQAELDYLSLDCLAERTLAFAQARKLAGGIGYDENLRERTLRLITACRRAGTKFIANLGAADPLGAAEAIVRILTEAGVSAQVAAVLGDDVLDVVKDIDPTLTALGTTVGSLGDRVVSANAYLGADPIVTALEQGADVVVGGRIADPSLFLAPLWFEHGWATDDLDAVAGGQLVGHLMECGTYLTGAYLADPPYVEVPDLWNLGYPIADVSPDGSAELWKLPGTGGRLDPLTCRSQALYEVGDPAAYVTPDVSLDLTQVTFEAVGEARVAVRGARGGPAPERLKVLVGVNEGFIADGELGFGGPGALDRARLAAEAFQRRFEADGHPVDDLLVEYIGFDSTLRREPATRVDPIEVRLRVAGRFADAAHAKALTQTFEWQLFGPAGVGGIRTSIRPLIGLHPVYIDRNLIKPTVQMVSTP